MKDISKFIKPFILGCCAMLTTSCFAPKDTTVSRNMQNLTARYNILYNARILLENSLNNINEATPDDYSQVLPIYKEPSAAAGKAEIINLDSVIKKANTIIFEKPNSNYTGAAYYLIAKANYLKANFYDANEFFNYISKTYPSNYALRQQAQVGQAQSLMMLHNYTEAGAVLDSALKYLNKDKKSAASVYATKSQALISTNQEPEAIELLQKALNAKSSRQEKIRWRFILAQLQERNGLPEKAYQNYQKVAKSNAPFEMAFNANVNRIGIENSQSGKNNDQIGQLKNLLKDEKNKDFTDQIYYKIAEHLRQNQQFAEAIENYNKSIQSSTQNQNQKGLSYLRLADIYFHSANYPLAKKYYDSTLTTLSPAHPQYQRTESISKNLDFLAERLETISREETLQKLAKLPENERQSRIRELESGDKVLTVNASSGNLVLPSKALQGKFYFDNIKAMQQGYLDFIRVWGNRKLEDNWRISNKTSAGVTAMNNVLDPDAAPAAVNNTANTSANAYNNLPLTAEQLKQSDERIINAYYDIANFYKDELKDKQEAIKTFEELLQHYPDNSYKLAIYYNLYLLNQDISAAKSEEYKNLLLQKYPDSPYSKVITDPSYSEKTSEREAALQQIYNGIYNLYLQKKYTNVSNSVNQVNQQFGDNKLSPQLAYLNALTVGHTQKLPAFENALKQITLNYPDNQLVTPLVTQQLQYIQQHRDELNSRPTALTDYDPDELHFVEEPEIEIAKTETSEPAKNKEPEEKSASEAGKTVENKIPSTPEPKNQLFSLPDSAEYYFVINVEDPRYNLNSSRFGIGQFNRTRYQAQKIKHQLKALKNANQIIFVGAFFSRADVEAYQKAILPLMGDIMKIPADKYNIFVITKEGLDQLNNSMMINSYLDFYRNNK